MASFVDNLSFYESMKFGCILQYYFSCSYVDAEGKQLVAVDESNNNIELGTGGSELVITNKSEKGTRVRTLGSREFIRYYRQKPRPSVATDRALALSLASRSESLCYLFVHCIVFMLFH
jgi:pre-60S factor REI1